MLVNFHLFRHQLPTRTHLLNYNPEYMTRPIEPTTNH